MVGTNACARMILWPLPQKHAGTINHEMEPCVSFHLLSRFQWFFGKSFNLFCLLLHVLSMHLVRCLVTCKRQMQHLRPSSFCVWAHFNYMPSLHIQYKYIYSTINVLHWIALLYYIWFVGEWGRRQINFPADVCSAFAIYYYHII